MKIGINKLVLLSTLSVLTLTGCSNIDTKENNLVINKIEINDYTIHAHGSVEVDNTPTDESNNITESSEITSDYVENNLGELVLNNEDNSIAYEIENNTDIVYNGVRYLNLYECINSLDTKYDKNTLINFIIKNTGDMSAEVYCDYTYETGEEESITFDEQLAGRDRYESLKETHGEPVTWCITLTNSENFSMKNMFGCYSYILISGVDSDIVLDMSENASGVTLNTNETESITEEISDEENNN